jgi:CRP-like cAMP-binding protein
VCVWLLDTGYPVYDPWRIARHYSRGWFFVDAVSSLPLNLIFGAPGLSLLKAARICRWRNLRKFDRLAGTSWMRIVQVEVSFLLVAHYFGLAYYAIVIVPFIQQELALAELNPSPSDQKAWVFLPSNAHLIPEGGSVVVNEYVCALYWALAAMTNLKGLPAHESRQCFELTPEVLHPLSERTLTMAAFIFGAMVYSSIYGIIGSFLQTLDASGSRYRKRMAEMNEFFNYHTIPKELQKRVRNYVEFQFSVTKGIDVEGFNNELPAHLQLELFLHLNRKMVEQVPLFKGMPSTFIKSIVMKLRPAVCIAGDHLFCAGDPMDAMYFVKRGYLHVIRNRRVLRSVREGSFLGELALVQPLSVRSVDVRSVTDSILLALDLGSFNVVVSAHSSDGDEADDVVQKRLKSNAYTRYNVRLTDESVEELMPQEVRRGSAFRRVSQAAVDSLSVASLVKAKTKRRSSVSDASNGSCDEAACACCEMTAQHHPHSSDLACAAADMAKRQLAGDSSAGADATRPTASMTQRQSRSLLFWKRRAVPQVSPHRPPQQMLVAEEDRLVRERAGLVKRSSVIGGDCCRPGNSPRNSFSSSSPLPLRDSTRESASSVQQLSWAASLGRRSSTDHTATHTDGSYTTKASSSASVPASATGASAAGGSSFTQKQQRTKVRATLAETWALSGKEAMALALSQGRFDRQIERHTDALREELQESIGQTEQRLLGEIHQIVRLLGGEPRGLDTPASAASTLQPASSEEPITVAAAAASSLRPPNAEME